MNNRCLNILCVDDMSGIRSLLSAIVKEAGHNSYSASNGLAALNLLEDIKIDLVFLDIKLPDISGIAVLERSRNLKYSPFFVAMTGFSEQQVIDKALSAGADKCIVKPFNVDDINNIIREIAIGMPSVTANG